MATLRGCSQRVVVVVNLHHPNLKMSVVVVSATQAPQQGATLAERTNRALLKIIRDNLNTQYTTQATSLAGFRDAVSVHSATEVDATLLQDFRSHVPLSNYDSYKPFMDKFSVRPCKEEEVENLLSPGLPDFFAVSSGTSGTTPKIFPKYNHNARLKLPPRHIFDPNSRDPIAAVVCTRYRDVKEVERAPGEVVQRIPVCTVMGGAIRRAFGWYTDDEGWMSLAISGYAVPLAATVIGHLPSFLIIHGLFFLARRDLDRFMLPFATVFVDLIHHIDENWDVLVSCIRDGMLPDLEGTDHVREYLQAQFHANPERAAELLEIGPPFSFEGWLARVWPRANKLTMGCSGQFSTVLPKVRSIVGPNVTVYNFGYGASEAMIGFPHNGSLHEVVLQSDDIVEFLDVSQDETHENLRQAWEVEVGKQYEPILTTRDGLWRYRLGDVLHIVGFDTNNSSPVFRYSGRRSLTLRLTYAQIADDQLLAAIRAFSSEDAIQVQEFTTVLDDRAMPHTVGFFVELAGPLGLNVHRAPQKLFDALATTNTEHQRALEHGQVRLPTIRIVKAGTFAEYRQWKNETANVASGQIKVPLVLVNPTVQEWILERVVQEL